MSLRVLLPSVNRVKMVCANVTVTTTIVKVVSKESVPACAGHVNYVTTASVKTIVKVARDVMERSVSALVIQMHVKRVIQPPASASLCVQAPVAKIVTAKETVFRYAGHVNHATAGSV